MTKFLLGIATVMLPVMASADITVSEAYVRSSSPKSAAAFMQVANSGAQDCQFVAAETAAAGTAELHTHIEEDGMMKMVKVDEGFTIPAGGHFDLQRGGAHVMMTGIDTPLVNGQDVTFKLDFADCGSVEVTAPVDNDRTASASDDEAHEGHDGH